MVVMIAIAGKNSIGLASSSDGFEMNISIVSRKLQKIHSIVMIFSMWVFLQRAFFICGFSDSFSFLAHLDVCHSNL